ncbi:hypothetical protein AMTR_s00001p00046950, partial [Amborella trichopoda]
VLSDGGLRFGVIQTSFAVLGRFLILIFLGRQPPQSPGHANHRFKRASLSFTRCHKELGAVKPQKIWLKASHISLQAWIVDTFSHIREACGAFIAVNWRSVTALSLSTIRLLVETLILSRIPPFIWLEVNDLFFQVPVAWSPAFPPVRQQFPGPPNSRHEITTSGALSPAHGAPLRVDYGQL